jgi:hypothetical protein
MRVDHSAALPQSPHYDAAVGFEGHMEAARARNGRHHSRPANDSPDAVRVNPGDTLTGIAHKHGATMKGVYGANPQFDPHRQDGIPHFDRSPHGGWDPDYLRPGDRIRLHPLRPSHTAGRTGAKPSPNPPAAPGAPAGLGTGRPPSDTNPVSPAASTIPGAGPQPDGRGARTLPLSTHPDAPAEPTGTPPQSMPPAAPAAPGAGPQSDTPTGAVTPQAIGQNPSSQPPGPAATGTGFQPGLTLPVVVPPSLIIRGGGGLELAAKGTQDGESVSAEPYFKGTISGNSFGIKVKIKATPQEKWNFKAPEAADPALDQAANPAIEPEAAAAKPTIEPEAPATKAGVEPEAAAAKPTIEPEAPATKAGVEPEAAAAKPAIEPEAPATKAGVEPEAAKPAVEPEAANSEAALADEPSLLRRWGALEKVTVDIGGIGFKRGEIGISFEVPTNEGWKGAWTGFKRLYYAAAKDPHNPLADTASLKLGKVDWPEVLRSTKRGWVASLAQSADEAEASGGRFAPLRQATWKAFTKGEMTLSGERYSSGEGAAGFLNVAGKATLERIRDEMEHPHAVPLGTRLTGMGTGMTGAVLGSWVVDKMVGSDIENEYARQAVDRFGGALTGFVFDPLGQKLVAPVLSKVTAPVVNAAAPVVSKIAEPVSKIAEPVVSAATTAVSKAAASVTSAATPVVAKAAPIVSQVTAKVSEIASDVGQVASKIPGSAKIGRVLGNTARIGPIGTALVAIPDAVDATTAFRNGDTSEGWRAVGRGTVRTGFTALGAGLGQTIIPIPGLGAAMGAVVGGMVGDWFAKKI